MSQKKQLDGMGASDKMDVRKKFLDGNIHAFFAEIYPVARESYNRVSLKTLIKDLGVPECLTVDGSKEKNASGTEFMKIFQSNIIQFTRT